MRSQIKHTIASFAVAVIMISCSDKGLSPDSFSRPCVDWNMTKEEVEAKMSGFEVINNNENHLLYLGKRIEKYISYEFYNNKLRTSAILVPYLSTNPDAITSLFEEYVNLGSLNNVEVFINEESNSLGTYQQMTDDEIEYYAIGWTEL